MSPGSTRAAVMVAHPGHELMIHHWMEIHRPLCCVLTDGSGSTDQPRTSSTTRVLDAVGASIGPIYARHSDRDVYRLLLERRVEAFLELVFELTDALIAAEVDCIAGDPVEGFNPSHDVNRFIVDGAVAAVRRRTGRAIANYDFSLDGAPGRCSEALRERSLWL